MRCTSAQNIPTLQNNSMQTMSELPFDLLHAFPFANCKMTNEKKAQV